jgi:phenylacetate-CoA ligase
MPALRLAASEPVESIVLQLNEWQPDMLVSYASMARILADEQSAGRLHIHPHLVFTSSEVLTEETRRRAEQAWNQRLFNQYATTETAGLAAECLEHAGLHLLEDLVIAEVVDKDNRPVSPGVFGDKVLVTVLLAPQACPCGRPHALVGGIQGRMEDVLRLPAAAGGEVAVQPLVFHRVMDAVPAGGWQVMQDAGGLHVLLSGVRQGFEDATIAVQLRDALAAQGAVPPAIQVERVAAIPQTAAGKAPLIKRNVRAG